MTKVEVEKRKQIGKRQIKKLREKGFVPAIIYGHKIESLPIFLPLSQAEKLVESVGESTILDLLVKGEEKPRKVLIHQIARHPLTGEIEHLDFYQIKEGEKITAEVEIELQGVCPAVKDKGGFLYVNLDKLEVECLPKDLPPKIVLDISKLVDIDQEIVVGDLDLPEGVKALQGSQEIVVKILPPRKEEEVVEAEEEKEEPSEEEKKEEKQETAEKEEQKAEQNKESNK